MNRGWVMSARIRIIATAFAVATVFGVASSVSARDNCEQDDTATVTGQVKVRADETASHIWLVLIEGGTNGSCEFSAIQATKAPPPECQSGTTITATGNVVDILDGTDRYIRDAHSMSCR